MMVQSSSSKMRQHGDSGREEGRPHDPAETTLAKEAAMIVDPDEIKLEQINEMAAIELSPKRRRGHGQTVVFPKGPPPPLDMADDDLPVCDSSGQVVQHSFGGNGHLDGSPQATTNDGASKPQQASLTDLRQKAASKKALKDNKQQMLGRNNTHQMQLTAAKQLEQIVVMSASKESNAKASKPSTVPLTQRPSGAGNNIGTSSKFFELFPRLNEQAIDLLGRCSEPETALDMLRQALSEMNSEKGIKEGMPHYKHKLMTQTEVALTQQQNTQADQQPNPNESSSHKKVLPAPTQASSQLQRTTTQLPPHHQTNNATAVAVSCFLEAGPNSKKQTTKATIPLQKAQHHHHAQKNQQRLVENSTKCASSNSTCERSTANFISSLKSSLVTTPATSPGLLGAPPLTQKELKDRTKESNLIVCLYYNLACCYQRLGLLEESVEYLELASDQLEDTVQFFEAQEDSLIKSRQLRQQQQQQQQQLQHHQRTQALAGGAGAAANYHTNPSDQSQQQLQKQQPPQQPSLLQHHQQQNLQLLQLHQKSCSIQLDSNHIIAASHQQTQQQQASQQAQNTIGGKNQAKIMANNRIKQSTTLTTTTSKQQQKRQLSNGSNNSASGATSLGQKRKELLKREKISIKDCAAQQSSSSPPAGSSAENLNNLLRQTLKGPDQQAVSLPKTATSASGSTNLLQRMSQGASKLLQTKEAAAALLQVSGDHLMNLHNSAEQLVQKSTGSMLPQTAKANQLQFASFTNNYSSIIEKNSSSGRNVSPVTTTSLPPEQSTVFSFHNNPTGAITVEQLLAEKMHKSRYQCKMNLQICALQSQLGKHQDALIYGRRAAQICYKLIKSAQMLCKRYVLQIQRHIQARQAKAAQLSANYNSASNHNQPQNTSLQHQGLAIATLPDQNTSGESPPSRQINLPGNSSTSMSHNFHPSVAKGPRHQKAFTEINDSFEDDYQAAQFYRSNKPPRTRIETGSNSSNGGGGASNYSVSLKCGGKKSLKRPRSSCSSNGSSRSSQTSQQGLTRLRLSRRSTAKLGCGAAKQQKCKSSCGCCSSAGGRESSTESLDKIHTFNLKNSSSIAGRRLSDGTASSVVNAAQSEQALKGAAGVYQNLGPAETSNNANASLGGMFMVDGVSITAANSQPQPQTVPKSSASLEESKSVLKAYADDANLQQVKVPMADARHLARNVYVEESVKVLESLIIQADPLLQELASIVKEFEDKSQKSAIDRDQDMIKKYGQVDFRDRRKRLKISFTTLKELVNIEKDQRFKLNVRNTLGVKNSQDWIFNLNIGNVMHLNMMKEQELNASIENTHELTKDTMLEKVVLITSAYFCIATEIRFILQKDLLDVKLITKKDSESYHAKALHIALLFLPEDCPLSQYINQTYCKNYLQPKLKLQKQRNAYISQKMAKQHQSRQKQLQQNLADKEKSHTLKKAMAEAASQSTQHKRPSTSLLKEMIGTSSKFLISTKSHEGLTNHVSVINTPEPNYSTGNPTSSNAINYTNNASLNAPEAKLAQVSAASATALAQQQNAIRKSGATPDLSVSKKSQAALSSQGGTGPASKHHKNTCLLVGSEQKLRQPNKATKHLPYTSSQKSVKQTSSLLNKYQTGTLGANGQPQRTTALHRGHYPSTGGFQPVLQSLLRSTATTASGAVLSGTRRVRSPQAHIGNSGKKNLHHHYSSTIGCNTDSTKEGVSGGINRIVRESSSVRKIKIDLGVICNQSPEHHRKTAGGSYSKAVPLAGTIAAAAVAGGGATGHQRSGSSVRRLSKKTSSVSSASNVGGPAAGPKPPRKVASTTGGCHQKTKLQHQQVKQHMGDCSTSGVGITTATINPPSTQQTTSIGRKQNILQAVAFQQQAASSSSSANQQQQSQHRQNQLATMQEKQAIMLAALKLLKMKQQPPVPSANKQFAKDK